MNSKETAEAIQMLGDMLKNGSAVLTGGKGQQSGEDIFKAGKIAMWESGIWPLESFGKPESMWVRWRCRPSRANL